MKRLRRDVGAEAGFTLLEVLIAMLVLGIILPAVAATLFMGVRTTDETNKRLLDSHDIQTAAAFFGGDVQNATSIATNNTTTCVSGDFAATGPLLLLQWTDHSAVDNTTVAHSVNYYLSGQQLVRSDCAGGGAPSALAVIHKLDASVLADVQCQPTSCNANPVPAGVAIRGKTADSGQMFSLTGTRRVL